MCLTIPVVFVLPHANTSAILLLDVKWSAARKGMLVLSEGS